MFFRKFGFFCRILAPAQRAAGGCSPPKVTPGRGLAARRIFFTKLIKIKDFKVEIIVFMDFLMSFPMKISCVFGKTRFYFYKIKNFKGTPSHPRNQPSHFFTLEVVFGGVRNDPMCQCPSAPSYHILATIVYTILYFHTVLAVDSDNEVIHFLLG